MAKIALVGYGSKGNGIGRTEDGYAYVVNDNVRTGQTLQPVATNWRSGRQFVTTGKVRHAYKETSAMGEEIKSTAESEMEYVDELTEAYTGKELGAKGSKVMPKAPTGVKPPKHQKPSAYGEAVRAGNLAMFMQKNPTATPTQKSLETFESYSSKFMEKGEQ